LVLDPKVLLPRADRRHGHRGALADDRQGEELWETQKITVVFIEHDMDIVFKIAPEIVARYGRIS
jgi:branched-chain amino acid transport system ATP-binding protein